LNVRILCRSIVAFASLLLALASPQLSSSQTRIVSPVKIEDRVAVKGTTSALLAKSSDTGRLPASQNLGRMLLLLAPVPEQDQAASQLVRNLHDPSSTSYHKWLTPAEFGARFGVADADAAQVQQWLQERGLIVHEVSLSRRFVVFSGNVAQVERAFSTEMHHYS
jgi:subtilase family serine protease